MFDLRGRNRLADWQGALGEAKRPGSILAALALATLFSRASLAGA